MHKSSEEHFHGNHAFSLYDLYRFIRPCTRTGGMKFTIFVDPSAYFGHHYYIHRLSDLFPGVEKKGLKDHQFYSLYLKNISLWMDGSWNLQFSVSSPNRCFILNLVKNDSVVHEKEMIKLDAGRRLPTHSNSHIALERLRWPKIHSWSTKWRPRYYDCTWK